MDLFPLVIHSIRPAITRDDAVKAFTGGLAGVMRRAARGPLRSVADIYVPFRLYHVTLIGGARRESSVLGVDSVTGTLDFYRFDAVPAADDLVDVCTRNRVDAVLTPAATHDIVASRVKRMMYGRVGFFAGARVRLEIHPAPVGDDVHVPYWAAFFGRGETASLLVMDGVRRQIEGIKVRRIIQHWLATV